MNKPHIHADLIKAWADGAEIEYKNCGFGGSKWIQIDCPNWDNDIEYRIKPKESIHAALINVWKSGARIQYKSQVTDEWTDTDHPSWVEDAEYRIAPEKPKFRVAYIKSGDITYTVTVDDVDDETDLVESTRFVKWLTPWVEYNV